MYTVKSISRHTPSYKECLVHFVQRNDDETPIVGTVNGEEVEVGLDVNRLIRATHLEEAGLDCETATDEQLEALARSIDGGLPGEEQETVEV